MQTLVQRLLILIYAVGAVRGLGILGDTLIHLAEYRALGVAGSPVIRAGVFGVLGAGLAVAVWGLWRRASWARRFGFRVWLIYVAFDSLWLILYAQADFDRGRIPFVLVTYLCQAGFLYWSSLSQA